MPEVKTQVVQVSESAAEGTARNHSIYIDRPEAKGGSDKGPMGGEHFLMGSKPGRRMSKTSESRLLDLSPLSLPAIPLSIFPYQPNTVIKI